MKRWVAAFAAVAAFALILLIAIQAIDCASEGGSYVETFPWYVCIK